VIEWAQVKPEKLSLTVCRVGNGRQRVSASAHSSAEKTENSRAPQFAFPVHSVPMPTTTLREVIVPPDHFEVVQDDAVLVAGLRSATAVCLYDAVEEAGALLHLRFIIRSAKPADVTDTTLATELLLLDRCIESLREAMPNARNLQAKIAAHLPDNPEAQRACDTVLTLVRHFLDDSGMVVVTSDVAAGPPRELRFRPTMGWLALK
jgi:chemotaxis receptor (MCP) glutamine deamidase CheD